MFFLLQIFAEYDELNNQMSSYNEEKPKLLKKAKEPKSDIDNMKRLEYKLKELKAEKEKYNKLNEEKKTKLKASRYRNSMCK